MYSHKYVYAYMINVVALVERKKLLKKLVDVAAQATVPRLCVIIPSLSRGVLTSSPFILHKLYMSKTSVYSVYARNLSTEKYL